MDSKRIASHLVKLSKQLMGARMRKTYSGNVATMVWPLRAFRIYTSQIPTQIKKFESQVKRAKGQLKRGGLEIVAEEPSVLISERGDKGLTLNWSCNIQMTDGMESILESLGWNLSV